MLAPAGSIGRGQGRRCPPPPPAAASADHLSGMECKDLFLLDTFQIRQGRSPQCKWRRARTGQAASPSKLRLASKQAAARARRVAQAAAPARLEPRSGVVATGKEIIGFLSLTMLSFCYNYHCV